MGFVRLSELNAFFIANAILKFCKDLNINMDKLRGLGFDGCSTMAEKEGGVQTFIREKYPKALFFNCSSHRLYLLVNDLNSEQQIQNTIETIKEEFFPKTLSTLKKSRTRAQQLSLCILKLLRNIQRCWNR